MENGVVRLRLTPAQIDMLAPGIQLLVHSHTVIYSLWLSCLLIAERARQHGQTQFDAAFRISFSLCLQDRGVERRRRDHWMPRDLQNQQELGKPGSRATKALRPPHECRNIQDST